MTEYKRTKPHLWSRDILHTCYDGHDCKERWTIGHHLAEALDIIHKRGEMSPQFKEDLGKIEHHIRKAWDKSK